MSNPPVLIVGAGPTGLNLALRLARHGTPFRLIDEREEAASESRALAVHARTLEFYDQLGLADAIVAAGTEVEGIHVHGGGRERVQLDIKKIGEGLSPYPFILDFPQDEHEHFLVERLRESAIEVERGTALLALHQTDDQVEVTLEGSKGREDASFSYVCGCDGARSKVREDLGIGFGGGTYEHLYYVADVRLEKADTERHLHVATGVDTFALRLPARKGKMERLVGLVPDSVEQPRFDDVRASAESLLGTKVAELNWFSTYRVHHRVADTFRKGRAFLLGDAGHLHSPVGGQGMNTGIGDAVNLSWKLAHVLGGRAPPDLLDTYEPERIAFARSLVKTTDRLFRMIVSGGLAGRFFRTTMLPTMAPIATRFIAGRRAFFRFASQIRISYPQSILSEGAAGGVASGDRLPWVQSADNFAPLKSLDWQLHIYGHADRQIVDTADALSLPMHVFPWSQEANAAGLARDAAYLVRPDGHVALTTLEPTPERLKEYCSKHRLVF
jgi:2-polyprenyl-6-methoxyphenol hydroxylase-like FAD-dependent oxidoreductase